MTENQPIQADEVEPEAFNVRLPSRSSPPLAAPFDQMLAAEMLHADGHELWSALGVFDPLPPLPAVSLPVARLVTAVPVCRGLELRVFADRKQILRLCFVRQTPATVGITLVQFERASKSNARSRSEPNAGEMSLQDLQLNVIQDSHLQMTFPSAGSYVFTVTTAPQPQWRFEQGLVHTDPEQPLVSFKVVAVHNSARKNAPEHVELFGLAT
jgi:hypothetical protein